MKLSPKVLDLEKRCRDTEHATLVYGPEACQAWGARIREAMTAEEAARYDDPEGFLTTVLEIVGVREVREARGAMVAADRADVAADKELKRCHKQRDDAAQELYDAISGVRQELRPHVSTRQEKAHFFVSGPTPRQPFTLLRWAAPMEEGLRAEGLEGVDSKDLAKSADRIRKLARKLDDALTAAEEAKVAKRIALKERQLAVEACEQTYLKSSRFVEAALRAAGFGEYARRVRGVGRAGRRASGTAAQEEEAGRPPPRDGEFPVPALVGRSREFFVDVASLAESSPGFFAALASLARRRREFPAALARLAASSGEFLAAPVSLARSSREFPAAAASLAKTSPEFPDELTSAKWTVEAPCVLFPRPRTEARRAAVLFLRPEEDFARARARFRGRMTTALLAAVPFFRSGKAMP